MSVSRSACLDLDQRDPLRGHRARFSLPEGVIYLDGNSLGALPAATPAALESLVEAEWGRALIRGWNAHGWIDLPVAVGEKIAPLLGAGPGQVIATDSTSVNLFKLLGAALALQQGRHVVLSSKDNFPTDLYVAAGLGELLGGGRGRLELVDEDAIAAAIDADTAVVMLTHVNFRTGRLLDLERITAHCHASGALALWDLSHSAGALPLGLDAAAVDLAVGCGYKYLNGGPGAPAWLYAARRLHERLRSPLTGWMGHAQPFAFEGGYEPAAGIARFLCGTPPVLAMRALDTALDVWRDVDLAAVRSKSMALGELFQTLLSQHDLLDSLSLASPADPTARGSQISLAHPEGYAIMQALIERGVIGDFREPDLLRFGFAPLYTRYVDVFDAEAVLAQIVNEARHREPRFGQRQKVT